MTDIVRFFEDKELTKEVHTLELGIVEAGQTKQFSFWVQNKGNPPNTLVNELEFQVEHSEVTIIEAPVTLHFGETAELILEWSPSVTLKEALHTTVRVQGKELYA